MARRTTLRAMRRLRALPASDWLRLAVIACAALAVALAALVYALAPSPDQARALVGHVAPSFAAPAAQGGRILAQPVSFDGHSGRPTLLVFFNTLCVHCLDGIQTARAVAQQPGLSPLNVVYLDAPGENAQITGQYMARMGLDPVTLLDHNAQIASRYGVAYYPSFILVDARGVVRAVWTGAPPSASEIRAAIPA